MRLSEIKPYKKNAKKHDETQIKNVMQSIKEFGVVQPIVVDRNNTIIIGHCRYEAMKRLGYDELQEDWVKVVDLSEEEAEKLRLLDNKLNESENSNLGYAGFRIHSPLNTSAYYDSDGDNDINLNLNF